jgi:hypothetical protein
MKLLLIVLALALPPDEMADGIALYREGRYAEALRAFSAAEAKAGEAVSPEILWNKALAALRSGEIGLAEAAADAAAKKGGAPFLARRDFLFGQAAIERSSRAERTAVELPEAGPTAFDAAIAYAETAIIRFQAAAVARGGWPEAGRNAERARIRLASLISMKVEADRNRPDRHKKEAVAEAKAVPVAPPAQPDAPKPTPAPAARRTELAPGQVKLLLDRLALKEKEKVRLRREEQAKRRRPGERDW